MRINFGTIFQKYSKDSTMSGLVRIPTDSDMWPTGWKIIEYKTYERFLSIKLPKPTVRSFSQDDLIKRKSASENDFGTRNSDGSFSSTVISLQNISNILYYSCGIVNSIPGEKQHRAQASGGARYPIEAYVLNFVEGDLKKKCYHYNVLNHTIEELWDISPETTGNIVTKYFGFNSATASAAIVLTGIPHRTTMKYGERGYRYMYLEAGAILGNIEHNALLEGLRTGIRGSIQDIAIEELLDLDGDSETVILGILLG